MACRAGGGGRRGPARWLWELVGGGSCPAVARFLAAVRGSCKRLCSSPPCGVSGGPLGAGRRSGWSELSDGGVGRPGVRRSGGRR
jgi:hypothetical protein